jgi:hypothetical protein
MAAQQSAEHGANSERGGHGSKKEFQLDLQRPQKTEHSLQITPIVTNAFRS